MDYLTNRLVRVIKKGGMIIAPRRAGKSQAILKVLSDSDDYLLVCHSSDSARMHQELLSRISKKSISEIKGCISHPWERLRSSKKIIIDEFFWNPVFAVTSQYHCAISSNPRDLILYNKTGRRMKIAYNEVWKG